MISLVGAIENVCTCGGVNVTYLSLVIGANCDAFQCVRARSSRPLFRTIITRLAEENVSECKFMFSNARRKVITFPHVMNAAVSISTLGTF